MSGNVDLRQGHFSQTAGGLVRLNGSLAQTVWSSNAAYSQVDITNVSAKVSFQDGLTVSTFTALAGWN